VVSRASIECKCRIGPGRVWKRAGAWQGWQVRVGEESTAGEVVERIRMRVVCCRAYDQQVEERTKGSRGGRAYKRPADRRKGSIWLSVR
jgi:hypothetical protein